MDRDKVEQTLEEDRLLIYRLVQATQDKISFHTSGNKYLRAEKRNLEKRGS